MNKYMPWLVFCAGAVFGAALSHAYLTKKYESIIQTEIDSVKAEFSRHIQPTETQQTESDEQGGYESVIRTEGYASPDYKAERPYVISPEDFGMWDYEQISLTYYADGVLADDNDEIVDDINETIGEDSLKHFGEYEDDCVHVRNDARKADYEILLDTRSYSDVVRPPSPYTTP